MEREELIQTILKNFINDVRETVSPFELEEGIDVLGAFIEYLQGIYNHEESMPEYNYEGSPFYGDEFIETRLLVKYRDKMLPFIKTRLQLYFAKDEYSKTLLFQKLRLSEALLTEEEYTEYIVRLYNILSKMKLNLLVLPPKSSKADKDEAKELIENPQEMQKRGFKAKNKDYSRNRQILLYYYVLKLMGVTKLDNFTIRYAEFGHALFFWPVDVVKDNDLYKKLCHAPYIQESPPARLKDLEYVKRQFENIEHAEGIAMVQKEIDFLKRK